MIPGIPSLSLSSSDQLKSSSGNSASALSFSGYHPLIFGGSGGGVKTDGGASSDAAATATSPSSDSPGSPGAAGVTGNNMIVYVVGALAVAALLLGAFSLGRKH